MKDRGLACSIAAFAVDAQRFGKVRIDLGGWQRADKDRQIAMRLCSDITVAGLLGVCQGSAVRRKRFRFAARPEADLPLDQVRACLP